ncbi:hypothetical protein ON010_g12991 [Phytophthora cinnamomi]|nr:hypothetical protein ON010_g12991 [Phytophthora cinnamomi]
MIRLVDRPQAHDVVHINMLDDVHVHVQEDGEESARALHICAELPRILSQLRRRTVREKLREAVAHDAVVESSPVRPTQRRALVRASTMLLNTLADFELAPHHELRALGHGVVLLVVVSTDVHEVLQTAVRLGERHLSFPERLVLLVQRLPHARELQQPLLAAAGRQWERLDWLQLADGLQVFQRLQRHVQQRLRVRLAQRVGQRLRRLALLRLQQPLILVLERGHLGAQLVEVELHSTAQQRVEKESETRATKINSFDWRARFCGSSCGALCCGCARAAAAPRAR